jgi:AcrR family transcriptional regulator
MADSSTKKPLKDRAIAAMLDLAAQDGWHAVTFQAIARKCKCKIAALQEIFEDRIDLLIAYGRMLDHRVMENVTVDDQENERDRLFEVMMERFDILNEDRAAIQSILKSMCTDPKQAAISLPHLGRSMAWMLEAAHIECNGVQGALKIIGLGAVYLYVLRTWMDDESEDMGKTMAALDRGLDKADWLAGMVLRG